MSVAGYLALKTLIFITPSPSSTHSSKIDLSYPEVPLPLSKNFTLPPKDGKKYLSQVDQVILSTPHHHHQNPKYMATNA
jgi:hypothetical protein